VSVAASLLIATLLYALLIAVSRNLGYHGPSHRLRRSDFLNLVSTWCSCTEHVTGKDDSYMELWRFAMMLAPAAIDLHQGREFQGGLPGYLIA